MFKKRRTYDVFVANLPPHVTEKSLSPLLTELGEVNCITIRSGRKHGGPRTAYVQYLCEPDADTAVQKLNGHCFEGWSLVVSRFSKDKSAAQGAAHSSLTVNDLYAAIGKTGSMRIPTAGSRMNLPSSSVPSGTEETLLVCHIKDVTSFYGQRLDHVPRAAELSREVEEFCHSSPRLGSETPDFDKLYGCQFSEDKAWYRCKVLKQLDNSQCFVQYVDFGNCEAVQSTEMVALRGDLATEAPLAVCYRLDGLFGVRRDEEPTLYAQAMHKIEEMVADQCVCVQMKRATAAGMHFLVRCRLERSGLDLGEELIRLGYAKAAGPLLGLPVPNGGGGRGGRPPGPSLPGWHPWGTYPSWGQRSPRPYPDRQRILSPLHFVSAAGEAKSGTYPGHRGGGYTATSRPTQPPSHQGKGASREAAGVVAKAEAKRQKPPQGPWASTPQVPLPAGTSPPALAEVTAQKELLSARLQEQEAKIKALGEEVKELKAARAENGFLLRLSKVLKLTEEAHQQRDQLSTDPARPDALRRAADALSACREEAWALLNTKEVEDSLARFRRAQDDVRACRDKEAVRSLVEERNDARSCLEVSLRRFVAEADKLPTHVNQESSSPSLELPASAGNAATVLLGREAVKDLERAFHPFLEDTPVSLDESTRSLEDLYAIHELNKNALEAEFQAKRHETDVAESHLKDALQALREVLCLSSRKQPPKEGFSLPFLEACLSNLQHSVASEVEACNLVGSSQHDLLSLLSRRLKKELSDIIERILNVAGERTRYVDLLRSLRPFSVGNAPDDAGDTALEWQRVESTVGALTEKRRSLRQLKSRLRHCLVDMEDVEPQDGAEWKAAAEAVSNLRDRVLNAFAEEDALMRELMKLQAEHFPELAVLHPELELEAYSKYKGLVKNSWELCAFCITEEGQDPYTGSWYRATNGDEQVLIKEFVVDTEETREELLSWAVEWAQLSSEHLLPIQAAFLSKDGRKVYLQVPWRRGHLLLTSDSSVPSTLLGDVLESVLRGLATLHAAGKAHGSIHPSAVLLPEGCDKRVLLDLPNFARILGKLKSAQYSPLNGLEFRAPELLTAKDARPTPEGDMYALGCLLLWMCFPNMRFQPTAQGIPSLSSLSSPRFGDSAFSIAKELLDGNPKTRPTATQVLESKSFSNLARIGTSEEAALGKEPPTKVETDKSLPHTTYGNCVIASATVTEGADEGEVSQFGEDVVEVEEPDDKKDEESQISEVDEIISEEAEGQEAEEDDQTAFGTDEPVLLPRSTSDLPPTDDSEASDCELLCTGPTTSTVDSFEDQFFVCQEDGDSKASSAVGEGDDPGTDDASCRQESFHVAREVSSAAPVAGSEDVGRGSGDAALVSESLIDMSNDGGGHDVASKIPQPRPRSRLLLNLELLRSESQAEETSSAGPGLTDSS